MANGIIYIDAEKKTLKLRQEVLRLLSDRNYDFLITLTFNRDVNEVDASVVLTKFIKIMNIACFGRRSNKSVVVVPVIERHWRGNCHVHLLMQDPRRRTQTRSNLDIKRAIRTSWRQVSKITADVYTSSDYTDDWFIEIYDQSELGGYLNKQLRWGGKETVDFVNYTSKRRGQTPSLSF